MTGHKIAEAAHGYPLLGANWTGDGCNFAVEVPKGTKSSLILYRKNGKVPVKELSFSNENRTGNICCMNVGEISPEEYEYNYRIGEQVVQDPQAYHILGREKFGSPLDENEHSVRCGFLSTDDYDWEGDCSPEIPYEDLILYKVHTRGYTKLYKNNISPKERGTFAGLTRMVSYWKELGVNAIELMPSYEFSEISPQTQSTGMVREKRQEKINYWGYVPGFYFAPKSAYCATKKPEREVRDFIKALHRAGMECIMEFYFPAQISPLTALHALQFWKMYYHVDGFHLVGEGVPTELMLKDPLLAGSKILTDGYDVERIFQNQPPKKRNIAVMDYSFQQDMRRFLKSDEDMLLAAAGHIRANSSFHAVVNFMTSQDGFTMQDLVSYNYKNNEANGEDNQDGNSYNYSWNCGIEGPTRKKTVVEARERQIRNAFLMMLLSQGVPMIYGGDEFGNSQEGNNNAWCQDNETGWVDWKAFSKNKSRFVFVKEAIAFRKAHKVLHQSGELKESDYKAAGFPDISFHGERAWYAGSENTSRLLGVMYCGAYGKEAEEDIYVGYNFHWENRTLALPNLPEGKVWKKFADTGENAREPFFEEKEGGYRKTIELAPRTIVVLAAKQEDMDDASLASF